MTADSRNVGEVWAYTLPVLANTSTITTATWTLTTGAKIQSQVDVDTSSTVLVSFPAAGTYKLTGTVTLASGVVAVRPITIRVSQV